MPKKHLIVFVSQSEGRAKVKRRMVDSCKGDLAGKK